MMESLSLEEGNIVKDIRNLFQIKNKLNYTAIKDTRYLFRLEKETKEMKDRILRDIKNLYYKPVRVSNFWGNNQKQIEIKHCQWKNILIKLEHI